MISIFNSALRIRKPQTSAIRPREVPPRDGGAPQQPPPPGSDKPASNGDNALSRLAKLAPSEVMTVYLAGKTAFVPQIKPDLQAQPSPQLQIFAVVMLILCFFWRWATTHEEGKPPQWMVIASSTISFGLWVCASDGKNIIPSFTPEMAGFLALLWTLLLAPLLNKGD